jgi:hypothetical protein
MRPDLEQQFIKQFVLKAKQNRYLGFVENPKRRGSFLGMLYHGQDLDTRRFQDLRDAGIHETDAILKKAQSLKTVINVILFQSTRNWMAKKCL